MEDNIKFLTFLTREQSLYSLNLCLNLSFKNDEPFHLFRLTKHIMGPLLTVSLNHFVNQGAVMRIVLVEPTMSLIVNWMRQAAHCVIVGGCKGSKPFWFGLGQHLY